MAWFVTTPTTRSFGVEHADARRVERHASVGVGGAVDRVDHGQQAGRTVAGHARLLREHGQPGSVEHRQRRPVRGQVEAILPRLAPARAPVLQDVERAAHGDDRLIEHFQEPNVVHGGRTLSAGVAPARLAARPPTAIRLSQLWLPLTSPGTWPI